MRNTLDGPTLDFLANPKISETCCEPSPASAHGCAHVESQKENALAHPPKRGTEDQRHQRMLVDQRGGGRERESSWRNSTHRLTMSLDADTERSTFTSGEGCTGKEEREEYESAKTFTTREKGDGRQRYSHKEEPPDIQTNLGLLLSRSCIV